jgi:protein SCO1/2
VLLGLLAVPGVAGCGREQPRSAAERYPITGQVVSVDKEAGKVKLAHDEVVGYMPPMTMNFAVARPWVLDAVRPGARISATLVVEGTNYHLDEVTVVEPGSSGDTPATAGRVVPEPGAELPDVTLVDQRGRSCRMSSFRGHTLVLTFIYTRCPLPDYCIRMTSNFKSLRERLRTGTVGATGTELVSVSIDPGYDTPAVLAAYARANGIDDSEPPWTLLTGQAAEVKRLVEFFGLESTADGDQIVHSLRTAVIDVDGRIVKVFPDNTWTIDEVVAAL